MADGFSRLQLLQGKKFLQSVKLNDFKQVEKLILHGVPDLINQIVMPEGECAIHAAVKIANQEMVKLLLDLGASIDRRDALGRTPMMIAVDYGYEHLVDELINNESNVTATDNEGRTALFYALNPTHRHSKCLEMVCKAGGDVNSVDNNKTSLLMKAAEMGETKAVMTLLDYGATTEHLNMNDETALFIAVKGNNVQVAEELLKSGCSIDVLDKTNKSPIHVCCQFGYTELLTSLIQHGGEPETLDNMGDTPLHLAVQNKNHPSIRVLLSTGVSPDTPNFSGLTPKALAQQMKDKTSKKLLRKQEVAIRKAVDAGKIRGGKEYWKLILLKWNKDKYEELRETFSSYDVFGSYECSLDSVINILRSKRVPISDNKLAEIFAALSGTMINYMEYLQGKLFIKLPVYADFARTKKKKKGKGGGRGKKKKIHLNIMMEKKRVRPFQRSEDLVEKMEHFTDTARFPRDAPPKTYIEDDSSWYLNAPNTIYIRVHKAVQLGDLKTIEAAIEDRIDLNQTDTFSKTPLMIAAANGRYVIAKKLVDYGVDVNLQDNFKWTALHHACHVRQFDIVKLLVEHEANIDTQAANGGTPLMRAVESGSLQIVSYLLDKGAKLNLKTKNEKTSLDIAYEWGSSEIIDLISKVIADRQLSKRKGSKKVEKTEIAKPKTADVPTAGSEDKRELSKSVVQFSRLKVDDDALRAVSAPPDLYRSVHSPRRRNNAWSHAQPTTRDLLDYKTDRRIRFGFEVADFQKPRSPFTSVIEDRMCPYVLVKQADVEKMILTNETRAQVA